MTHPPIAAAEPVAPARRPGTITALLGTAAAAAVSAMAGAAVVLTGGAELAAENVRSVFDQLAPEFGLSGMSAADVQELSGPLWQEMIDSRTTSLAARGVIAAFFALWVLGFALCAGKAATWARVLVTIGSVLLVLTHLLIVSDYPPGAVGPLGWVAVATGLAAVVLCWLPANNRYARAAKLAHRP
ncbi:hypothetical protein [Amycolatopsis sp. 195334CR]|uniref:hypothetical protein n=1 Tax=Amycolatopsis sp. 195334CR TaxID=2814588 RepID=UPI0027DD1431|nr:hypothetical protein [Amycolatopsis sp. 195334CR]